MKTNVLYRKLARFRLTKSEARDIVRILRKNHETNAQMYGEAYDAFVRLPLLDGLEQAYRNVKGRTEHE